MDVSVGMADLEEGFSASRSTTPHECRLRDLNYSAPITVNIEYLKLGKIYIKNNILIGR